MTLRNPLGDAEIADPQALRALAHPVRLALLEHLQRGGPATATQLAPHVGASPSVTSWHLRHLARFGLVVDWDGGPDRRQRWWQAPARGFRFEMQADGEGLAAARQLARQMFLRSQDLPQRWMSDVEPQLEPEWRAVSGLANTRLVVTAPEAAALEEQIELLLAPYVTRDADQAPAGSRGLRLLRFTMPEPADPGPTDTGVSGSDGVR